MANIYASRAVLRNVFHFVEARYGEVVGASVTSIVLIAIICAVLSYYIYRKKKYATFLVSNTFYTFPIDLVIELSTYYHFCYRPPVPLGPTHNSMNPDYVDTDNVYIPDEWELERTKVKIGKALGQGSFGMVYEGIANELYNLDKKPKKVAIKTVNNSASLQERINFLNEASRMK